MPGTSVRQDCRTLNIHLPLAGDRVYAIGTNAVVRSLDKTTGKLLWTRDLQAEFASPPTPGNGCSISPIVYEASRQVDDQR